MHRHPGEIDPRLALVIAIPVGPGGKYHTGDGVERLPVEQLALPERRLGQLMLGDIIIHPQKSPRLTALFRGIGSDLVP